MAVQLTELDVEMDSKGEHELSATQQKRYKICCKNHELLQVHILYEKHCVNAIGMIMRI